MSDKAMAAAVGLVGQAEALAALAAHYRVEAEHLDVDPETRALLARIATQVTGDESTAASPAAMQIVGMARALMREAVSLMDDPSRRGDWAATDEAVLQGLGRVSMAAAGAFVAASRQLDGLADVLARPGAAFLDVGTGTGWLAIATARAFGDAHVTGIDVYEPALARARRNVDTEGMADRVELRRTDVAALDIDSEYDAIWLPLPFLPRDIVPDAIERAAAALRPGGWLLPGTFTGADEPLSEMLTELRTRRSGGHPWNGAEIEGMLSAAGLDGGREVPRTWPAPLRLYAARRALTG